jgi:hypothetical protein
MIRIESDTCNIDAVMSLLGASRPTSPSGGTWNRIPWRVYLMEPSGKRACHFRIMEWHADGEAACAALQRSRRLPRALRRREGREGSGL